MNADKDVDVDSDRANGWAASLSFAFHTDQRQMCAQSKCCILINIDIFFEFQWIARNEHPRDDLHGQAKAFLKLAYSEQIYWITVRLHDQSSWLGKA